MKRNINVYSSILLTMLIMGGCANHQSEPDAVGTDPITASISNTADQQDTEEQDIESREGMFVSVRGFVDVPPEQRVFVSPFYGGYVKDIKVLPGNEVNKGDILFTMQNPSYLELQQQYLEAVRQLEYLKEDYERQKVLSDEEIASRKNYKKAESDYQVMQAKATGLREQLKMLGLSISAIENGQLFSTVSVRSTIEGSVTGVNIQKGVYLDPKDVAVSIVNTDHLHLELEVFEQDAPRIKKGQEIRFVIPEIGPTEYAGSIYLVVPAIDMEKRTFLVHGHIEEDEGAEFLPGMYVDAHIKVDEMSSMSSD